MTTNNRTLAQTLAVQSQIHLPHGRYGSVVASCFKGAEDLNRSMVANDWAVAYQKYSRAVRR